MYHLENKNTNTCYTVMRFPETDTGKFPVYIFSGYILVLHPSKSENIGIVYLYFVPVQGEILTAMRWHRMEISTAQWCGTWKEQEWHSRKSRYSFSIIKS